MAPKRSRHSKKCSDFSSPSGVRAPSVLAGGRGEGGAVTFSPEKKYTVPECVSVEIGMKRTQIKWKKKKEKKKRSQFSRLMKQLFQKYLYLAYSMTSIYSLLELVISETYYKKVILSAEVSENVYYCSLPILFTMT